MSSEKNKAVIRWWIEEAWNKGNVSIADEIYAPDFVAKDASGGGQTIHGPEGIKQEVMTVRAAVPDIQFTIDHLVAEGDMVVGAFTMRGSPTGALWGTPAKGKQLTATAVDIWRFKDGKIVERHLALLDRLGLLQQLGVDPRLG